MCDYNDNRERPQFLPDFFLQYTVWPAKITEIADWLKTSYNLILPANNFLLFTTIS
jgi:hypothetical protein